MIFYTSTRGNDKNKYSFSQAIQKGIAQDGGLLVPETIPRISLKDLKNLSHKSYRQITEFVFNLFETDIPKPTIKRIINQAYAENFDNPEIAPIHKLKDNQ